MAVAKAAVDPEHAVLSALAKSGAEYLPSELIDLLREKGLDEELTREAIWRLLGQLKLEFSSSQKLRRTQRRAAS